MEVGTPREEVAREPDSSLNVEVKADELFVVDKFALLPRVRVGCDCDVERAIIRTSHPTTQPPASNAADPRPATGAGDVVRAKPLGIVALSRVLGAQRLPERNLATGSGVGHHRLVLGTVHMCHHPRPHQHVGLHCEPYRAHDEWASL